jgi:hypothetical protein
VGIASMPKSITLGEKITYRHAENVGVFFFFLDTYLLSELPPFYMRRHDPPSSFNELGPVGSWVPSSLRG